jgi:hypothetical protein
MERAPGRRQNGCVFTHESIMQQKAFDLHFQRQLLRVRRDMRRAFSWSQDDGVYFDPRMLCGPFRHSTLPTRWTLCPLDVYPSSGVRGSGHAQSTGSLRGYQQFCVPTRSIPPGTRGSTIGTQYDSNITAQNAPVFQALQSR